MKSGETLSFPIQELRPEGIVARGGSRFLYRDIARLEKRQFEKTKTIALVLGLGVAAFCVLIVLALATDDGTFAAP